VATPEAFERQPSVVHRFYDARRSALEGVEPNDAHRALARLEEALGDGLLVVTQNIDDLHERAGSRRVVHMHGRLRSALCRSCGARVEWDGDLADHPPCPRCHSCDLRPDVVWFGEVPHQMDLILDRLRATDLFVSIGTSGAVYPAAGFVQQAALSGARTLELNLEPSEGTHLFDEARHGPASVLVPAWVDELLG
jgi:NAD-dependent deacetylase